MVMHKYALNIFSIILCFAITCFAKTNVTAQTIDCNFMAPSVLIDFGTNTNPRNIDLSLLGDYRKSKSSCPVDGSYTFTDYSTDCFGGKWHILSQDHSINDVNGRMMVVNASERPSTFFIHNIEGLIGEKVYEFSFWVVNICKWADGCSPTPPNIKITLYNGKTEIDRFMTGNIPQTAQPNWRFFSSKITLPAGSNTITMKMEDITNGGCGNDFAMDDIMFKECRMVMPEVKPLPKPVKEIPKPIETPKPVVKITAKENVLKPNTAKPTVKLNKPIEPSKVIPEKKLPIPNIKEPIKQETTQVPKLIATRENIVARKIIVEESELQIDLYDNGEIDGDTVSIYHNNALVVSHAGISASPINLKIKIDKNHPHHELVMVAENLGSIPPNTSLMVITANKKRYEVFISSSEQKNAKVIIDLK